VKLAQPLLGFLLSLTVLAGPVRAEFAGPIIDAHSQFGCEIWAAKVRLGIDMSGVAHTLCRLGGVVKKVRSKATAAY
tara:strand:- start:5213 stop:5443 length:231 start_codon:yes stop_codon:yes gene_type:complete